MLSLDALTLDGLPDHETDEIEYKSSDTAISDLATKISKAASAFWNSGGGVFVAGVDDAGKPDGGIPLIVGRQPIRDWVDQIVYGVHPSGSYSIRVFDGESDGHFSIQADLCVVVIRFESSVLGPHMAPDKRYYIRAGAHTVPAPHFIVDAIWARRGLARPVLMHTYRLKPGDQNVVQLGVIAMTEEPAVQVEIDIDPVPEIWKGSDPFPITAPIIDRQHPFYLDLTTWHQADEGVGPDVKLAIEYRDLAGNEFHHESSIEVHKSISPWQIGGDQQRKAIKALESIDKTLQKIAKHLQRPSRE